jgi:hypothetical protein
MKAPPEMSAAQFNKALAKHGFKKVLLWVHDTTGKVPGVSWGIIMHRNGKTARRATLAKIIREREEEIALRQRQPAFVGSRW